MVFLLKGSTNNESQLNLYQSYCLLQLWFICTIYTSQWDVTDSGGTSVLSHTKIL
jgi:hypothetical protein